MLAKRVGGPAGVPAPGGITWASAFVLHRRFALSAFTLLAVLAAGVLLSSGLPAQAQANGDIDYAENGTGAVATFSATDPENAGAITWSLLEADLADGSVTAGADFGAFAIDKDSGVLTFDAEEFPTGPDYEMPEDDDNNNVYAVTVVATDAAGMKSYEQVTVTVTDVDEPGTVTLSAVAPYPGVELTATHSDPDGTVTGAEWQWSRSRSRSGSYAAIADAEAAAYTPTSGDDGYYLRATVTYNDEEGEGKRASVTSMHTVQDINEPNATPMFADEDSDTAGIQAARMVEENTPAGENVGLPVVATDGDSDILTYTIDDDADPATAFETFDINAASGQITTKAELNTEDTATYTVTVTATDPAGASGEVTVTITVTNVNEPPSITGDVDAYAETTTATPNTGDVATFTVADPEAESPDPVLDLTGADASLFTLTQAGVLTFDTRPDYEAPADADKDNAYELTIGARDADGIRGTRDITVKVTNVDEPGTVTLSAVQPRVGIPITASLTDEDGPVSGVTWQWSITGASGTTGTTPTADGDIEDAKSDTYTPTAEDVGGTLTATPSYTDPQGAEKPTAEVSLSGTAGAAGLAVAADTRNKAPVFDDQDSMTDGVQNTAAERTVEENTAAPAQVGGPVTATDPNAAVDSNDVVSYRLGGADASAFDIGLTTGQITVATGTKLDFETKSIYRVTVIATDTYGASASIPVTINVTDVDEGPEISISVRADVNQPPALNGQATVSYPENGSHAVETYTATDPEGAAVTWSLTGDDAGAFTIVGGVLAFVTSPDYETPADTGTDNVYEVTVTAADPSGLRASIDVTVTVTDVDETGPEQTLLERYDDDSSGAIEKGEMIEAINDYLFGTGEDAISKNDMIEVINLYLFG